MLTGADTGFLISLANAEEVSLEVWKTIVTGENTLIISTVSLNELLVHFYKRGKTRQAKEFLEIARELDNVFFFPLTVEIAELSAKYRYSFGIPTVDSLILATFIHQGCLKIYTSDRHFLVAERLKMEVILV